MKCLKLLLLAVLIMMLSGFNFRGCATIPKQTTARAGSVSLSHDPSVKDAPRINSDTSTSTIPVPAGSKLTLKKVEATPATKDNAIIPAYTETLIELPKGLGTEIKTVSEDVAIIGSDGYAPLAGPSPTEKATAAWTYAGIGICALGIFFCTPWGGSNYRVGGLIAAGGIAMSLIGKFIDQIKIPAPAIGLIFIVLAVVLYYGYRLRHKQIVNPSTPTPPP